MGFTRRELIQFLDGLPDKYMNIVRDCLRDFAQKVYNVTRHFNVDEKSILISLFSLC